MDNQNNTEGYADLKNVEHGEKLIPSGNYEEQVDGERIVQDYEDIGQKPHRLTMDPPASMSNTMGMVEAGSLDTDNYMLLDRDEGVYDVMGADLPTPYPRTGSPDNLGKDSNVPSQATVDDYDMKEDKGEKYHSFDSEDNTGESGPVKASRGGKSAKAGELEVIIIYAPWCGWSKKSLPDFKKIESRLNNLSDSETNGWDISVKIYDSDTPTGKDKVKEYNVEGFPSVIVEVNKQKQEGPRGYDEMIELVNNIAGTQIN